MMPGYLIPETGTEFHIYDDGGDRTGVLMLSPRALLDKYILQVGQIHFASDSSFGISHLRWS